MTVRDIWVAEHDASPGVPVDVRTLIRQPVFVPERSPALDVLEQFQRTGTHIALVIDEHGGVDGLVTLNNLLEFLVAPPRGATTPHEEPTLVQRTPASWLVDGALSIGDFYAGTGIEDPEAGTPRSYHTVAGLVMTRLG